MKINIIPTIISASIGAVITYIEYLIFSDISINNIITIGVAQVIWFIMAFGISFDSSGKNVNIKTLIATLLSIAIITNIVFMIIDIRAEITIAINALLLLISIGISYGITKSKI